MENNEYMNLADTALNAKVGNISDIRYALKSLDTRLSGITVDELNTDPGYILGILTEIVRRFS